MLDVSWGEIAVLTGVGFVLIGRRDLPIASRALGTQVGRIVGLLQGARLRADRFATDHQLKKLQNEFKSGLRELDAVKAELAGSMMSTNRGIGGGAAGGGSNNLGAMVSGVDRKKQPAMNNMMQQQQMGGMGAAAAAGATQAALSGSSDDGLSSSPPSIMSASSMGAEYLAAAQQAESTSGNTSPPIMDAGMTAKLAPRSQSVAAVAEEEWEKRGIGFRSIAEGQNQSLQNLPDGIMDSAPYYSAPIGGGAGGAVILSNYLRQSLIYDQYERTVREQDDALRSRVDKVRNERLGGGAGSDNDK